MADCTAYALADMHKGYIRGRGIAIACPKLDSNQEAYEDKIASMIDDSKINTLTVMTMEVPCCQRLLEIAKAAAGRSKRKIPIKSVVVSVTGEIRNEGWI